MMVDFKVSMILGSLKYAGELSAILTDVAKNIHSKEMDINKVDESISKIPDYYMVSIKTIMPQFVKQSLDKIRKIEKFRYSKIPVKKDTDIKFSTIYNQLIEIGVDKKDLDPIMIKSIDDFINFLINLAINNINYLTPKYPMFPNYGTMGMYDGDVFGLNGSAFNMPITSSFTAALSNNYPKTASPFNTIPFSKPCTNSYEYYSETDLTRYLDPVHRIMDDDDDDDDDEDRWVKSNLFK